ncbi:uncharacterized protein V1518DRAFT_411575 [Limtongia smithiae]|uniref:uncharacterized protein n=1 Tax=Limtongia smithiae TaxID=1125753 RepID=UPI0034CD614E
MSNSHRQQLDQFSTISTSWTPVGICWNSIMSSGHSNDYFRKLVEQANKADQSRSKLNEHKEHGNGRGTKHYHQRPYSEQRPSSSSAGDGSSGRRHAFSLLPAALGAESTTGVDDKPAPVADKNRYRDRASERRRQQEEEVMQKQKSGLDFELLNRVRRGEDVFNSAPEKDEDDPSLDEELDELFATSSVGKPSHGEKLKSKSELLAELRERVGDQRSKKSRFVPISKSRLAEDEDRRDYNTSSTKRREGHVEDRSGRRERRQDERGREHKESRRSKMHAEHSSLQLGEEDEHRHRHRESDSYRQRRRDDDAKKADEHVFQVPTTDSNYTQSHKPAMPAPATSPEPDEKEPLSHSSPQLLPVVTDAANSREVHFSDDDKGSDIFGDAGTDYDPLADLSEVDEAQNGVVNRDAEQNRDTNAPASSSCTSRDEQPLHRRSYFNDVAVSSSRRAPTTSSLPSTTSTSATAPRNNGLPSSLNSVLRDADIDAVVKTMKQARATAADAEQVQKRGLVALQVSGSGDYDIDIDMGGEGRWADDDDYEDGAFEKSSSGRSKSKRRKR